MKRLLMPALFALMTFAVGCGPFNQCVKPYSSQVTWNGTETELGEIVGIFLQCDPTFSGGEAPVCALESLNVLEGQLGPDGKAIIDCIVTYYETNGTAKQQAAAKAVGAKRMVNRSALLRCPTLAKISKAEGGGAAGASRDAVDERATLAVDPREGSVSAPPRAGVALGVKSASPANPTFAYAGESVSAAAARCRLTCGTPDAIGSPGAPCLCQRKVDGQLRWMAAR